MTFHGSSLAVPNPRVQLCEIDRLCNPNNGSDTDVLRGGIEINEHGAPQAYHLMTQHPGDMGMTGHVQSWERIPAWTDWRVRPRVMHVFDRTRIGQNRGVSILSPVIPDFHIVTTTDAVEARFSEVS